MLREKLTYSPQKKPLFKMLTCLGKRARILSPFADDTRGVRLEGTVAPLVVARKTQDTRCVKQTAQYCHTACLRVTQL